VLFNVKKQSEKGKREAHATWFIWESRSSITLKMMTYTAWREEMKKS
jgi:hypothetical protein